MLGFWCSRGCTGRIGAQVCGPAPPKPQCFGERQPYGGARGRVWELELGLGLQAKAKAATRALRWRVPDSQTMGTA